MAIVRRGFDAIRSRLTGIGFLSISASWNPPVAQRTVILRLFNFLENRRVLYVPMHFEVPDQVDQSVIQIRNELTQILNDLPEDSPAARRVRHLRTACRRFLEDEPPDYRNIAYRLRNDFDHGSPSRWHAHGERALTPGYFVTLGELRATFGLQLSALAAEFEIDVEEDLASIFPVALDPRGEE
ncbi:hypothetical protein EJ070_28140 [Mesorhizobium sp. M1E.F.Ca.ET.045.02.1.1]|uniref:DUF6650 family protein n=1 Tax=unclassified Mesorhizobium TaxID=325217 RepID=UPI000F75AA34|nr:MULTISPECIES: DUF6650 family protein [unclassified Mesorhizobium]AZO24180.1 hypothetical protein EJ070_28140 [Mesorhizobium sp. M1E.F.Ca.ET.045.02.1.1]RUW82896.1 hypothetical protein EOA29_15725 [Mesorhizobium sp. M1E.F.Ca.ET.063.01.1.1]TKB10947.1 MAG: hypothetical protein E5V75_27950 [Mesorhizobium sp.]